MQRKHKLQIALKSANKDKQNGLYGTQINFMKRPCDNKNNFDGY